MADIVHLDGIWTKFLELWPVEKVRVMTLEQYHTLNDPTCFQRCLESMTEMLGSIWGGYAIKFGIYERSDKGVQKKNSSNYIYSDIYVWRPSLGNSPEEAFLAVKRNILGIIDAVQSKDLDAVSSSTIWPMIAWKIAFLYQDRDDPQVLSVYRREKLIAALGEDTAKLSTAELYRRLMARRNGKNLHEYSEEIWNMPPQDSGDGKGETTGTPQPAESGASIPLNQILYGPPGTGKTYATVEKALEIFAAAGMRDVGATREKKRQRFDELVADGHIRFVTFHQSFSYEDFVEGIRASTDEGKITYQVEDGIFKELCIKASSRMERPHRQSVNLEGRTVWKMSLGNTQGDDASIYDECLQKNCLLMGYGGSVDFSACRTRDEIRRKFEEELPEQLKDSMYPVRRVELFAHKMAVGDIVIISDGNHKFRAIGQISGPYQAIEREDDDYGQYRAVKWLCTFSPSRPAEELLRKKFTQLVLYQLTDAVLDRQRLARLLQVEQAEEEDRLPYVIIIDEINRGNISRIFGELITLVESSHRTCLSGSPNTRDSISVRLPYSRDLFSVPENVYIIGTMNTADRSLTGLDAALRRRFSFTEMPPRPELLEGSRLHGTEFSLADLLDCLNRRITALLDGDHCLGHAWFMGLGRVVTAEALTTVFRNHILPLLEEYFFEDWEKIQWALNDHRKEAETSFLLRDDTDLSSLFGDDVQLPDRGQGWHWNPEAFGNMASYAQIIDAEVWPEPDDEADTGNCGADEETAIESFTDLGEQIDSVEWREYRIERYRTRAGSNPIRVFQNGKYVGDRLVSQALRVIAAYLDIELKGANTQSQGNFLIQKLKELGQKA